MTHFRAVCLMILVTLLWSMAGVVTRHLDSARSFEVTFWRSFFTALALIVALSALRGKTLWTSLTRLPRIVWISGVCWAVMFSAFMLALTLTSVANVLVTMAVGPLVTALLGKLVLGQTLSLRTWGAIAIASLGIGWMFATDIDNSAALTGTLVALAVPLAAAVNLITLQFVGRPDQTAAELARQDMLAAVLIGAMLSALATLPLAMPLQSSNHDLGLLALLGVAQLAIPCLLLVRLSQHLPAHEIALLALLEVIFGVTWAWLGAGERPSNSTLVGGAMVLGALLANEILSPRPASRALLGNAPDP